jgi:hypothetical protein
VAPVLLAVAPIHEFVKFGVTELFAGVVPPFCANVPPASVAPVRTWTRTLMLKSLAPGAMVTVRATPSPP